eukprot:5688596-Pleurochrysis_carterae.AAC.1
MSVALVKASFAYCRPHTTACVSASLPSVADVDRGSMPAGTRRYIRVNVSELEWRKCRYQRFLRLSQNE